MDQATLADLKHFIATTITSALAEQSVILRAEMRQMRDELRDELRVEMRQTSQQLELKLSTKLGAKIDDLSAAVAEALDATTEANEARFSDHDRRLIRLEQKLT